MLAAAPAKSQRVPRRQLQLSRVARGELFGGEGYGTIAITRQSRRCREG